jgi:DNA-binding XRE family transcriptional regulator
MVSLYWTDGGRGSRQRDTVGAIRTRNSALVEWIEQKGIDRMSDNGLGDLESLTSPERLTLLRRRDGHNQEEAARSRGVSRSTYSRWELGLSDPPEQPAIKKITPAERCFIYRRRAGYLQKDVAAQLGCSRYWVNLMELGEVDCDSLLWFWEQ